MVYIELDSGSGLHEGKTESMSRLNRRSVVTPNNADQPQFVDEELEVTFTYD